MKTIPAVVSIGDDSTTVYTGRCFLYGIYVNTVLSAHALPIKNGSTTLVTLPASAAAGAHYNFPGILFDTSLIVDPDDTASGNITLAYVIP